MGRNVGEASGFRRRFPKRPPKLTRSAAGGGAGFQGKRESGRESPYSCLVLAGQRTMDERRAALEVRRCLLA